MHRYLQYIHPLKKSFLCKGPVSTIKGIYKTCSSLSYLFIMVLQIQNDLNLLLCLKSRNHFKTNTISSKSVVSSLQLRWS